MKLSQFPLTRALLASAILLPAMASASRAQEIDVMELTIEDIQAAFAAGTYTSEQLTQTFLDRIATYEPSYNAFTFMAGDALEAAKAIDARRAAGEELGPLAGIPVVIKEAMDVAGLPSTAGWAPMASEAGGIDLIPGSDAPVVARLRAAGAIVLGKSNIPVFSAAGDTNNSWAGPTFNAVDRALSPGGSSAGSALSVAANLAVGALGEETRGSLQIPAAAQSVVAIKPSFGLVPNTGVTPLGGSTTDVVGPMTRTVADGAIMLDALAGYTAEDAKTVAAIGHIPEGGYTTALDDKALEGARIGLFGPGFEPLELTEETAKLYEAAIAELTAQGAVVVDDPFADTDFAALGTDMGSIGLESMAYDFDQYIKRMGPDAAAHSLAELREKLSEDPFGEDMITRRFVPADYLVDPTVPPDLSKFVAAKQAYLKAFKTVMDAHDLDAFAFPVFSNGVPALGDRQSTITVPEINIPGLPAVTVPAGQYEDGAPFALIFFGSLWSEPQLIGYAYDYEQATHHRIVPELTTEPAPVVE